MLDNIFLLTPVADGSLLTFTMARGTELWNIRREYRRKRVLSAKNLVGTMAFLTGRGVLVIIREQFPVRTQNVLLSNLCVTRSAIHLL